MRAAVFLAAAAVTGTVAGLGIGVSQRQIRDTLGNQCIADQRRRSLRLDYGLLEFNLFAGVCETIAVQVHRLARGTEGLIPAVLSAHFQGFSGKVPFESLRNEVEASGAHILEESGKQRGYRCYRIAESHVNLYVVDEPASDEEGIGLGDLWSIMISGRG